MFEAYLHSEIEQGFKDVPSFSAVDTDGNLVDLLVAAKISPSKRQAREDIANGAVTVNGETNYRYILCITGFRPDRGAVYNY